MLLKVNTSGFVTSTLHSEAKVHRIELRLKKASKHDTSFVVRSSTPFDYQPEVNQNSNSALISAQLLSFRRAPALVSSWPSISTSPACRRSSHGRPFPSPDH
ncbi:hypothetical protein DPMN_022146 [Dreissena polymorpha]|uniref:Uncharacterized protein n=1 Tax=Dreissena polymorpha TaxID=45954 RepID=A0A9D4NM13_DREPO|nr:hypothetical protein DPMN_022146 [Dreissena polymorpha]